MMTRKSRKTGRSQRSSGSQMKTNRPSRSYWGALGPARALLPPDQVRPMCARSQPCPPWIAGCDPDHNESRQSDLTSARDYFLQRLSEAHMRKHISFAVAAAMLILTAAFWAKSGVLVNSADAARLNVSYSVGTASFLPVRVLEPTW